jgi:predicted phage tail protein
MKKSDIEKYEESGAGIPLVVDSYDDIFSDFDPRPYSDRALSGDFLLECKKASVEKKDKIRIKIFLPKGKRSGLEEIKIKKRLKDHFNKHFREKRKEISGMKMEGAFWIFMGAIMMVIGAFFLGKQDLSFAVHLLITLVQPAGWFFLWEGLAKILLSPHEKMPDFNFYKKMANSEISFANN